MEMGRAKLDQVLEDIESAQDFEMRFQMLIEFADRFQSVPDEVATRPFPEKNKVLGCESEAYIWVKQQPNNTLKFYFAVENPQGISAKALAVILDESLSGLSAQEVAQIREDMVYRIFGKELSMGKGVGLKNMVGVVRALATQSSHTSMPSAPARNCSRG